MSESQKFSIGSHLWLIFFEPHRQLFKTINWRTHFLLQSLDNASPFPGPLLVDTHKVFPNDSILCLSFQKKIWFQSAYQFWRQLNKPSIRIFIPLREQEDTLFNYWPTTDSAHKISYYKENTSEKI